MHLDNSQQIARSTNINPKQVNTVLTLLKEGATIPFIARYRKDLTGGLEDHEIFTIHKQTQLIDELVKRKAYILETLSSQNVNNEGLHQKIENCWDKKELEDLFLPYKTKRKTKASTAKELGLEPLAKIIMSQNNGTISAGRFVKGVVKTEEEAIDGALDIINEWIAEHSYSRTQLRRLYNREGMLFSKLKKGKEEEAKIYKTYFDFEQKATKVPSHRVLAILRATDEGFLSSGIAIDKTTAVAQLERNFVKGNNAASQLIKQVVQTAYSKNLKPALEKEFIKELKLKADKDAVQVFSKNLEQLLLATPIGKKRILAIDPGYKTGCKVVCLNAQGDLLTDTIIYPHPPQQQKNKTVDTLIQLVQKHNIEAIAIGNGTAGRDTEILIKSIPFDRKLDIYLVNEDGASIYSASEIGREEFPNHDITVRGAVSIGRRLVDPLAELVKIDPKSMGVGQYQHDVDQTLLKTELDHIVEKCVNKIGVQLNTASKYLLQYISGIGPSLAKNIVDYRTKNGKFTNLKQLKKVPRLGDKAFEQCAGFLRLEGEQPLDNTGVHPELYDEVSQIAKTLNISTKELIGNSTILSLIDDVSLQQKLGKMTLTDLLNELAKPNQDPRNQEDQLTFDQNITSINHLYEGMILKGQVSNITNFGAFVDLGIKENGLIHISQISDTFISSPNDVLHLNQIVNVKIIQLDLDNKRIGLTMKF
ncbi:Tex family protein [Wenyingzhuangia sp. 2_MG-2023]|uniref:Tex family protein n=1 Tax=Wenyingzhuangia sp. 2_MG-2023 TaxID=3062639 RepID=UPI0026E20424|nr:Tex family protein [Wenyingzhuangia sp. 2_MG-2023]MDO6737255.1 Tex family protein [Wenyingzhuangia sp. 2_MG-2023]